MNPGPANAAAVFSTCFPLATDPVKETNGTRGCDTTWSICTGVRWSTFAREARQRGSDAHNSNEADLANVDGESSVQERGEDAFGAQGSLWGGFEEDSVSREERRDQSVDLNEIWEKNPSVLPTMRVWAP